MRIQTCGPAGSAYVPLADVRRSPSSLDGPEVFCEDQQVDTVKQIISKDGKYRLDIEVSSGSLYRYVTFDDRYRNDPDFQAAPEWTIDEFSGLYESVEAVEAAAIAKLAWLRE